MQTKADIDFCITTRECPWSFNYLKTMKRSRTFKSRNRVIKAHFYSYYYCFIFISINLYFEEKLQYFGIDLTVHKIKMVQYFDIYLVFCAKYGRK